MRKFLLIITCIFFSFHSLPLSAEDPILANYPHQDNYSWDLSDKNMHKIAAGMIAWGIFMAAVAIVVGVFVPNGVADTTTTPTT